MRITADQQRCIGAGQCVLSAPEVFDQDQDEGVVTLLQPRPPDDLHADVRRAVERCPSGAITLHND